MKPIYLYLPVCILGIPMLVGLLVASGQSDSPSAPADTSFQTEVTKLDRELEEDGHPLPDASACKTGSAGSGCLSGKTAFAITIATFHGYRLIMQKQNGCTRLPIEKRKLQRKK